MTNPYLIRKNQHRIGKAGRASETRVAKNLGGRARPASGALEGAKGDVDLGFVLMECKSTTRASLSLKHDWLAKIGHEARAEGKMPALAVSFVTESGEPARDGEWVMIPLYRFKELI